MTASVNRLLSSYTERGPIGIHVAPVSFLLRMLQRIAVAFGSRRDEIFRAVLAGDVERVKRAQGTDLESGDAVQGVIHRTGGAGEVENVIDFTAVEGLVDIDTAEVQTAISLRRCSRFDRFPVSRLSTATTEYPSPRRASHKCEPRNPAPPVTRARNFVMTY